MRLGIFKNLLDKVGSLILRDVIDEDLFEELEELLLASDININTVNSILSDMRTAALQDKLRTSQDVQQRIRETLVKCFDSDEHSRLAVSPDKPTVYLFVGVNGVGKTTTIGKLARRMKKDGKKVLLAACDTFRAAAADQLEIWAERAGADIVQHKDGADPSAVIFDAVNAAKARGADFVLADTAGRQHTSRNLIEELRKINRITEKALGRPADEVILVLDAVSGQNAIRQAQEFLQAVSVTGIALAKLDSSARGGAVIAIKQSLNIPVKLIGVGEGFDDIQDFHPTEFINSLF